MKHRIIGAVVGLAWLVTVGFAPMAQVQPDGPIIWQDEVNDSFTTGFCGFPMEVTTTGTGVFHLFLDEEGNFEKIIITEPTMRITFTNLDTGETVWTPSVNMAEEIANEDGTGTKTLRGLQWHLIVPREGLVTADTGRIDWLFTFDDQGNIISEDVVFSAGIQEGVFAPALCQVLG